MGAVAACGAMAQCPMGAAPAPVIFLPGTALAPTGPLGMIADCIPFMNIIPFGVCMSLANPSTAALTAAALGVLTPGPCLPTPAGTWLPTEPSALGIRGPVITADSMLICAFGGCIKLSIPGQVVITS